MLAVIFMVDVNHTQKSYGDQRPEDNTDQTEGREAAED